MEIMNSKINGDKLQTLLNKFACANTECGIGEYSGKPYLNNKTIQKLIKANDFEIIFEKTKTDNYRILHFIDGRQTSKSELSYSVVYTILSNLFGNNTLPNNNLLEIIYSMQYESVLYILFENMIESWTIRVLVHS